MHTEERERPSSLSLGEERNMVTQLVLINVTVFILLFFTEIIYGIEGNPPARFHDDVLRHLLLPADPAQLIHQPWVIITSLFTHTGTLAIFSNMVWLCCFGYVLQDQAGHRRILPLYLFSGLAGVIFYLAGMQLIPAFRYIQPFASTTGAAASIMGLAIGATVVAPQYRLLSNLPIPFWIVTVIFIIVNIASLSFGSQDLTSLPALIGGALAGYIYMKRWQKGHDMGQGFNKLLYRITHLFHPKVKAIK